MVVFAGVGGALRVPASGGADASQFVGGDGAADAGTVEDDAKIGLAVGDRFTHRCSVVRVINGVLVARTKIESDMTEATQLVEDDGLGTKTAVIGANSDAQASSILDSGALDQANAAFAGSILSQRCHHRARPQDQLAATGNVGQIIHRNQLAAAHACHLDTVLSRARRVHGHMHASRTLVRHLGHARAHYAADDAAHELG